MNLPIDPSQWTLLDSVDSTQTLAANWIQKGKLQSQVVLAREQTSGKGRFGRQWDSPKDESLSMSLVLAEYMDHPRPWFLGMSLACAAAGALHCRLRWPNDLYLDGKKVGGILTEIIDKVPILGIGVNLNQQSFEGYLKDRAISLAMHRSGLYDPIVVAGKIVQAFNQTPIPMDWPELAPIWEMFDDTPGKKYKLADGEEAVAIGIGPHGELLCSVHGEARSVLAAETILF